MTHLWIIEHATTFIIKNNVVDSDQKFQNLDHNINCNSQDFMHFISSFDFSKYVWGLQFTGSESVKGKCLTDRQTGIEFWLSIRCNIYFDWGISVTSILSSQTYVLSHMQALCVLTFTRQALHFDWVFSVTFILYGFFIIDFCIVSDADRQTGIAFDWGISVTSIFIIADRCIVSDANTFVCIWKLGKQKSNSFLKTFGQAAVK